MMTTPVTILPSSSSSDDDNNNHDEDSLHAKLVEPLLSAPQEVEPTVVLTSNPNHRTILQEQQDYLEPLIIDESSWEHGERQTPSFRNWVWAVLFAVQFVTIVILALLATVALSKGDFQLPEEISWNFQLVDTLLFILTTTFSITLLSALLILLLLGALADMMIQVSLVMSPISCGLTSLVALMFGQLGVAIGLAIFCVLGVCYAVSVWHRIPFATANLAVALAAIHANKGLLLMAYATTVMDIVWTLTWFMAVAQVSIVHYEWIMNCPPVGGDDGECHLTTQGKWIVVALLFSLYWTGQVIRNVFHTTIAGVVGTFWFSPSTQQGCCNVTMYDSWVRSSLYSFGTICLGSLLVAVLQVLQILVKLGRQQRQDNNNRNRRRQSGSILWCLLEFVIDHLERLMEYINAWAFVYVGLYGYEYWTASQKVYQLFRARGWSVILNDHLISRSLGLMQVFIGLISGALAVVLGLVFFGFHIHPVATFTLGVILGTSLSNIQLQVVTSAVATVVVCFAEAPSSLVENHPSELSGRMIRAWRVAYPDECGF